MRRLERTANANLAARATTAKRPKPPPGFSYVLAAPGASPGAWKRLLQLAEARGADVVTTLATNTRDPERLLGPPTSPDGWLSFLAAPLADALTASNVSFFPETNTWLILPTVSREGETAAEHAARDRTWRAIDANLGGPSDVPDVPRPPLLR